MEEIKKNLRAVLLSKVGGVPFKSVGNDYRTLIGHQLNWKQFNFQSLEQFLNDIPDVVRLYPKKGEIYAFGVADNMSFMNPTARKAQFKSESHFQSKPEASQNESGSVVTVFIGGLPLGMTQENLKAFLNAYSVQRVHITKCRGVSCAWVRTSRASGDQMCTELNGLKLGKRHLRVEPAEESSSQKYSVDANDSSGCSSAASLSSDVESVSGGNAKNSWDENFSETPFISQNKQESLSQSSHPRVAGCLQQSNSHGVSRDLAVSAHPHADKLDDNRSLPTNYSNPVFSESLEESLMFSNLLKGEYNSKLIWESDNELPPLIDAADWEEYERFKALKALSSKRKSLQQPQQQPEASPPPPPILQNGATNVKQNCSRSSTSIAPSSDAVDKKKEIGSKQSKPSHYTTFSLYVSHLPAGTNEVEMMNLFKGCIGILALSPCSCFVIYNTLQEVENASQGIWYLRGKQISVDVATRHKKSGMPNRNDNRDLVPEVCLDYENLICTVGSKNERMVHLANENKSSPRQKENHKNLRSKSSPTEMPPPSDKETLMVTTLGTGTSKQTPPLRCTGTPTEIPPLLSTRTSTEMLPLPNQSNVTSLHSETHTSDDGKPGQTVQALDKLSSDLQKSLKGLKPIKLCNISTDQDSLWNSETMPSKSLPSPMPSLNSQDNFPKSPQRVTPSRFLEKHSVPEDHNDMFSSPVKSLGVASAAGDCQENIQASAQKFLSFNVPHSPSKNSTTFSNGQQVAENVDEKEKNDASGKPPCNSLPTLTTAINSSLHGGLTTSVPNEMRIRELQGFYRDTFPGGTMPSTVALPDVVDIFVTCVVRGFDDIFFWGQVASEPLQSDLRQVFELGFRMAEISNAANPVAPESRRGGTKFDEDCCRVWIKQRGKTASLVFFIDYGNFEMVPNSEIFELPEEFWKVRPAALPFKIIDCEKVNVSDYVNRCVTAKVNKGNLHSAIFEISKILPKL